MPHKKRKSSDISPREIYNIQSQRIFVEFSVYYSTTVSDTFECISPFDNHQDELKHNIDSAIKDLERLAGGSHAS